MAKKSDSSIDRRRLLERLGWGTLAFAGGTFGPASTLLGQGARGHKDKFVIYIHCGSWCGYSGGLLMPTDVNQFPLGAFHDGSTQGSLNPNVNEHFKTGNLIFNRYNRALAAHASHLCYTVGNPRNLDHATAKHYQFTGGNRTSSNVAWITGAAQALWDPGVSASALINTASASLSSLAARSTASTANVSLTTAADHPSFVRNATDRGAIPRGDEANAVWATALGVNAQRLGSLDRSATALALDTATRNLIRGAPEIAAGTPAVVGVEAAISRERIDAVIDAEIGDDYDGAAVKEHTMGFLFNQLRLAAVLIESRLAKGLAFSLEGHDFHTVLDGSSSVATPRAGGQFAAQLRVFWDWVVSRGYADDVLVIVSHDFTRSPYPSNPDRVRRERVIVGGVGTEVAALGTDHWLVMGMFFLNGRVPAGGRVGAVIDGFAAVGSADLAGRADLACPAYTSTQLVGSMFMRCLPQQFPTEREVRRYWPDFSPVPALIA